MPHAYHHAMYSPARDLLAIIRRIWTKCNEWVYNIDTVPNQPFEKKAADGRPWLKGDFSDKARHDDNTWYESPDYWYLRKIARIVRPKKEGEGVFYDIGSGKGRILCLMSRLPFQRVVGIELFEDLCVAAQKNIEGMRGRKAPVDILCEDAARADLSDGTVYFMFNPFGRETMQDVLQNIRQSLEKNPRELTIVYYNAVHEDLLENGGWLTKTLTFNTFTGRKISFWKNEGAL